MTEPSQKLCEVAKKHQKHIFINNSRNIFNINLKLHQYIVDTTRNTLSKFFLKKVRFWWLNVEKYSLP